MEREVAGMRAAFDAYRQSTAKAIEEARKKRARFVFHEPVDYESDGFAEQVSRLAEDVTLQAILFQIEDEAKTDIQTGIPEHQRRGCTWLEGVQYVRAKLEKYAAAHEENQERERGDAR